MNRNSTPVCGHGADRRHRGADIPDPGLGKGVQPGCSADRTAAGRARRFGRLAAGVITAVRCAISGRISPLLPGDPSR